MASGHGDLRLPKQNWLAERQQPPLQREVVSPTAPLSKESNSKLQAGQNFSGHPIPTTNRTLNRFAHQGGRNWRPSEFDFWPPNFDIERDQAPLRFAGPCSAKIREHKSKLLRLVKGEKRKRTGGPLAGREKQSIPGALPTLERPKGSDQTDPLAGRVKRRNPGTLPPPERP